MQTREVVTDVQETLQLDMSPIAKEWKENPPLEIPIDSSTPKRFAGRLPSTRVLGDADSEPGPSQPSGSKAAVVDDTATVGEDELMCALKVMNLWFVVMALETSHLCLMIFFILRPL